MISPSISITGLGVVCGAGIGHEAFWAALTSGGSAIRAITRFDAGGFPCGLAAEVPSGVSAKDSVPKHYRKAVKVMARDTELAVVAAALAVKDARLTTRMHIPEGDTHTALTYPPDRMGCQIGAGLIPPEVPEIVGAFASARETNPSPELLERTNGFSLRAWGTIAVTPGFGPVSPAAPAADIGVGGMNNLQPLWMLKYLPNMLACHVTIIHGAEGPSNTITCSEASSLLCIGESARVIERGSADICFSGGAESKVNLMGMMRAQLLGRLARWHQPDRSLTLSPYDPTSTGTVPGEGAAIIILERDDFAQSRGVTRYAHIVGFGAAQGAPAQIPMLKGEPTISLGRCISSRRSGLTLAIAAALKDAGIPADAICAIIPQAIGVPSLDSNELASLREIFGPRLAEIPLITLPPFFGDCAAGAGGLQVAAAALCLHHQMLPARLHGGTPAPGVRAGAIASEAAALEYILVCTGSLAGENAAVILKRA